MLVVVLIAIAFLFVVLAKSFRSSLSRVAQLTTVIEKPPLPRALAPVREWLDAKHEEGRLSREEHDHLTALLRMDAESLDRGRFMDYKR